MTAAPPDFDVRFEVAARHSIDLVPDLLRVMAAAGCAPVSLIVRAPPEAREITMVCMRVADLTDGHAERMARSFLKTGGVRLVTYEASGLFAGRLVARHSAPSAAAGR